MATKRKYIIITPEGKSLAPKSDFFVNTFHVLGIIDNVETENEALIRLLKENDWIIDAEYNISEFIFFEIK